MLFGVPGLKKTLSGFFVSIVLTVALVSCGYNSSSKQYAQGSIKLRAFVSNPVFPNGAGGGAAALEIVDASRDLLSASVVPLNQVPDAGMMAVSPKRDRTLTYSPANHALAIVSNAQQAVASTVSLLGPTESMFVWTDNTTAFVAVPNAAVAGLPAGAVERIDLANATVTATIPVPGARFLVPSPSGKQILVISDSANTVDLLAPSLIGSGNPLTTIPVAFDKPVWAVFSADGSTAYVMNCGPECGGTAASVSVLDMSPSPAGSHPIVTVTLPVPAASIALLSGSTSLNPNCRAPKGCLYVAGTPVALGNCAPVQTSASTCGQLTVIDANSMTIKNSGPLPIADGYHNQMALGANAQLFIGSRRCTNLNTTSEVRGCLSVINTTAPIANWCSSTGCPDIISPPHNGDVTGIEPIPNRTVVYVCEGGQLKIYDTTTDKLQTTQVSIVGQAIDVKVVDF